MVVAKASLNDRLGDGGLTTTNFKLEINTVDLLKNIQDFKNL